MKTINIDGQSSQETPDLLNITLSQNYLQFADSYYKPKRGVLMAY